MEQLLGVDPVHGKVFPSELVHVVVGAEALEHVFTGHGKHPLPFFEYIPAGQGVHPKAP